MSEFQESNPKNGGPDSDQLVTCPECGSRYAASLPFCPSCSFTPSIGICQVCNSLCSIHMSKCNVCGANLSGMTFKPADSDRVKKEYESLTEKYPLAVEKQELTDLQNSMRVFQGYSDADQYIAKLQVKLDVIREQEEQEEKYGFLTDAVDDLEKKESASGSEWRSLRDQFQEFGSYRDAEKYASYCHEKMEKTSYEQAVFALERAESIRDYQKILKNLDDIGDYEDAAEIRRKCAEGIEAGKKKRKKNIKITAAIVVAAVILCIAVYIVISRVLPSWHRNRGEEFLEAEEYTAAAEELEKANGYQNSETMLSYVRGCIAFQDENYEEAVSLFNQAADYGDSEEFLTECADFFIREENYSMAAEALKKIDGKKAEQYELLAEGIQEMSIEGYDSAIYHLEKISDLPEAEKYLNEAKFRKADQYMDQGRLNTARSLFEEIPADFVCNDIPVRSRLDLLQEYSGFVDMCGEWGSDVGNNRVHVRQTSKSSGIWHEWTSEREGFGQTLDMRCTINDDGTVHLQGEVTFTVTTEYSVIGAYVESEEKHLTIDRNVWSVPNGIQLDDYTTLSFTDGQFELHYNRVTTNEDIYFNYTYASDYVYNQLKTAY